MPLVYDGQEVYLPPEAVPWSQGQNKYSEGHGNGQHSWAFFHSSRGQEEIAYYWTSVKGTPYEVKDGDTCEHGQVSFEQIIQDIFDSCSLYARTFSSRISGRLLRNTCPRTPPSKTSKSVTLPS